MKKIFINAQHIISPLAFDRLAEFECIVSGISSVKPHHRPDLDDETVFASLFDDDQIMKISASVNHSDRYTLFEKLLISSADAALKNSTVDPSHQGTVFVVSSTKGNISMIHDHEYGDSLAERMNIHYSASLLSSYFQNPNKPLLVSNACISGLAALIVASRLLISGAYENAVICGADVISRFVYSGFKSLMALSPGVCKPFSSDRDGINLGEAGACMIMSTKPPVQEEAIVFSAGFINNDANHISGPSRTGEELSMCINDTLNAASITAENIDFISAHGTATIFNDEMEAKAFSLSGLGKIPINSMKASFGHTLGAAGIIESALCTQSLMNNILIPNNGFSGNKISDHINVCTKAELKPMKHCLKTASGFGGCNAAAVFSKINKQ